MKSPATSIILVIIILITIPFWLALAGGVFGLLGTLLGAVLGGIFSILGHIITLPFHILGDWNCHWPFGFWPDNSFSIAVVVLLVIILAKARK
jgi:hypothetical protein